MLLCVRSSIQNGFTRFSSLLPKMPSRIATPRRTAAVTAAAKKSGDSSKINASKQQDFLRIAFYLREPLQATVAILRVNQLFLAKVEKLRNSVQSPSSIVRHVQRFHIPQQTEISSLLSNDRRSRIIASYHFGDFVYGLHKLLCLQDDPSKTLVLSQSTSSPEYIKNMASGFGDKGAGSQNQALLANTDVRHLCEFLRIPMQCLVMFADLPREFGESVDVEFLGRKAAFPKSIALLSLVNKVPILPVICFQEGGVHRVEAGRQIEPRLLDGETRTDAVNRITQLQINFFQYFFTQHKEQWRYLHHLPKYFAEAQS